MRALALAFFVLAVAGKPKAPAAPARPAPKVDVVVTAPSLTGEWSVKLTNSGTDPVRIVADSRLLSFEITAPTGGAKVKCTLPSDMAPASDLERGLVLVSGRSYTERFDPRLHCFGERESAALVAGATVAARYGFGPAGAWDAAGSKAFIPLVATDAPTAPGPARWIDAAPVTLPPAATPATAAPPAESSVDGVRFAVTTTPRLDVASSFERQITVSVRNTGQLAVRSLFTPATVGFVLTSPDGSQSQCGALTTPTPIPELLTTLAPGGRTDVTVGFALCPSDSFRRSGLYKLEPRLDTRRLGTSTQPLYRGIAGGTPSLLRLHQGTLPRPAPQIDPP